MKFSQTNCITKVGGVFAIAVLFLGFLYPAFSFLLAAFQKSNLGDFLTLLFSVETRLAVAFTLVYSLGALIISFLISLPLALFFRALEKKYPGLISIFDRALQIACLLPSFFYALFTIELFRQMRNFDPLFELYSMRTVLVGWVLIALPFLTLSFLRGFRDLDPRESEMIQSLGANRLQAIRYYLLPKLGGLWGSAFLQQTWLFLTSFTLVVILGGGPPHETLEVGVYNSVRLDQLNYAKAFALAIWQVLLLVGMRLLMNRLLRYSSLPQAVGLEWQSEPTSDRVSSRSFASRVLTLAIVIYIARAFLLVDGLLVAAATGVVLSGMVALLSVAYALACYYFGQRFLAGLGAWISPMVLSLAWWKAYAFSAPSLLLCLLIQTLLLSPWIARSLYPLLARARHLEIDALRTLGATPCKAWVKVEWPRLKPSIYGTTALIFGLSLAEVSTVILFSRGDFEPLAVWVQNQFSRFQFSYAFSGSLLMIALSVLVVNGVKMRQKPHV